MKLRKRAKHLEKARRLITIGKLLSQGYTIEIALDFIKLHSDQAIAKQISQVQSQLESGKPVNEALQLLELPSLILSMIYFYEEQGDLANGFSIAGALYEKKGKERRLSLLSYCVIQLFWYG